MAECPGEGLRSLPVFASFFEGVSSFHRFHSDSHRDELLQVNTVELLAKAAILLGGDSEVQQITTGQSGGGGEDRILFSKERERLVLLSQSHMIFAHNEVKKPQKPQKPRVSTSLLNDILQLLRSYLALN